MQQPVTLTGSPVLITIGVMLASMMAMIDVSVINVASADIRTSFGVALNEIAWVSTSYMMANVIAIPMSGWFQRRFGYRNYFTASLLLFTAGSALCGLSWDLPSFVVFRIVQGLGGGALIPTGQAILFLRYPPARHGTVAGLMAMSGVLGPLLGPYIGGVIIDGASWHWIFLVNIPFGLIAAALVWENLRQPGFRPPALAIDFTGIALLVVGLSSMQYVLEEGYQQGWTESVEINALSLLAAVALVTFVVHELEVPDPIVNFRLFASRSYAAASVINFLIGMTIFSGGFAFAVFCSNLLGYSALETGTLLLQGNLVMVFLMPFIGSLTGKMDGRWLIAPGMLLVIASMHLNARISIESDFPALVAPLLVRSFGIAFVFVPLLRLAVADVDRTQQGNASALYAVTRELGGSIGTAWMMTMAEDNSRRFATFIGSHATVLRDVAWQELVDTTIHVGRHLQDASAGALAIVHARIMRQALLIAFNEGFLVLGYLFMLALPLLALIRRPALAAR